MQQRKIIIGTRGSQLARAQTAIVARRIGEVYPDTEIEIKTIVTSGDRDQKNSLAAIGGKGIFIRELEIALIDGSIDIAVHSFKDVTAQLAYGLTLAAFLRPESVCDAMVTRSGISFEDLPSGARIGTGSMRRKVQLLRLRPDLQIAEIRGNVDTRIAKVDRGEYDGVMLSEAGLIRLGLTSCIAHRFDPASFYPAPGQGVITIETRKDASVLYETCVAAGDRQQLTVSTAELALLETVGFDCRTPLGVYTGIVGEELRMSGFFVDPEHAIFRECSVAGSPSAPKALGADLGKRLLAREGVS